MKQKSVSCHCLDHSKHLLKRSELTDQSMNIHRVRDAEGEHAAHCYKNSNSGAPLPVLLNLEVSLGHK
jgi:hypothetical protein